MFSGRMHDAQDPDREGPAPLSGRPWRETPAVPDAASDTVTGLPFMQVELPSRRWYIEAATERAAPE